MLTWYHIVLLLFRYTIASTFQFENSGCRESWLCLVDGKCAVNSAAEKSLELSPTDLIDGDVCKTMVQIRKIDDNNGVIIIKYRKRDGETLQDLKLSINSVERFGCKVVQSDTGDRMALDQVLEKDIMELSESASYIDDNLYTCAGYVKKPVEWAEDITIDKFKLVVTHSGGAPTNYANTGTPPVPPVPPLDIPVGCDPLLVNSLWRDGYDEEYLNKKKIILPQNDAINSCQHDQHGGSSFGLFYKRYLDVPPQPVIQFSCSSDMKYSITIKEHTSGGIKEHIELANSPFMLFCAEYVSTKCTKPTNIECGNCTEVNDNDFTPGTGIDPPTYSCKYDGHLVKEGEQEIGVSGTPICQTNPSNITQSVWTILSFKGQPIVFSAAACHSGLTCWTRMNLKSECDEDKECTQADISHSGAICPNNTFVGEYRDGSLESTASQVVQCHSVSSDWDPVIVGTGNVGCYFNSTRNPIKVPSSWTEEKISLIGFGVLFPVVLLLSIIIFIIYFVIIRRRAHTIGKNKKMCELSGVSMNPDGTEKDAFTIRKEQCPGVEERLLRRRSEKIELSFDNLSYVRSDYINDVLIEEFLEYSTYERSKFAEGVADGMGRSTVMHTFLQLFNSCLSTEDEFKVWYHFVTAIRIAWIALKMKKATKMGERLLLILRQFGLVMLTKYGAYPLTGETEAAVEMRSFAYYALLRANCPDMVTKMCQLYDTMLSDVTPGLRRIVWTTVVRKKGIFDEIKEYLVKELIEPTRKDDIRWGTKREDLIYALCSTPDRDKGEPFLNTVIREPQYTAKEVLAGFTSMVHDFDDCHDGAKFLFTERHNQIKAKMGVETEEYRQIFKMFYQFATISLSSDDWLQKFMAADETFNPEERKLMGPQLAKAVIYGGMYKKIHRGCFNKRRQYDLRRSLKALEKKYVY